MESIEFRHLAAALHLFPTVVWAILAASFCHCHGTARPRGVLRLFRILCGLFATHYGLSAILQLTAPGSAGGPYPFYAAACDLTQLTTLALLPVFHHLLAIGALDAKPPPKLQLVMTYGSAIALAFAVRLMPTHADQLGASLVQLYLLVMTTLILWQSFLQARRGWRPTLMAHLGRRSYLVLGMVLFAGVVAIVVTEQSGDMHNPALVVSHTLVGLAAAAPFALRILGEMVRRFLVTAGTLLAVTVTYLGFKNRSVEPSSLDAERLIDLAAIVVLVLVLVPGRAWLRAMVDHLVLRRSFRWTEALQRFGARLSPERGIREICRSAVEKIARVLQFRGVAIHLEAEDDWIVSGRLDLNEVRPLWAKISVPENTLPNRAFDLLWLEDRQAREALYEARVTWIVPISTPQGRWGHVFVASGLIGSAGGHAKLHTLEAFAQQLARVLDVAALLERARTAERSLAEAEKLAVLGETAARIAHEIRNPITAARCLAQLLADGSGSKLDRDHAELITHELDRVEREVKALLDFARRDRYQLGVIDLTEVVGATLRDLDALLSRGKVEIDTHFESGLMVEGDAEKLRQVFVNLVVNARDALATAASPRRVSVSAVSVEESAVVTIEDSGEGLEPELLASVFEPFVTRKTQGTGLGLAIAKRIVEAHGGKISAAASSFRGGLAVRVMLPLATRRASGLREAI